MYELCERHGLAHERCGKLIVAARAEELGRLSALHQRASANGVRVALLRQEEIQEYEPHAVGVAALHSPDTGIADYSAVASALARDVREAGGRVLTGVEVRGAREHGRRLRVQHRAGELEVDGAVFCAGAWSDRLARRCGAPADPRIVPFRGAYLRLRPGARGLVRGLIYPVADPRLPFLGVHLTRRTNGEVLVGPTALLAPARGSARGLAADALATLSWPGTWRLALRHRGAAMLELRHALSRRAFVRAAAVYVPALSQDDVEWAFAGIRAQALGRDGALIDDFAFSRTPRALHVRNAPSPGATACLAIARHVAGEAAAGVLG
jgi:2-hydroxyglutarate dehydrogenase